MHKIGKDIKKNYYEREGRNGRKSCEERVTG